MSVCSVVMPHELVDTNVSDKHTLSNFRTEDPEDGDSMFFRNNGIYCQESTR
jgi:hypothetical protein